MKRVAVLGAGLLLLGGCALPLPVQVASWALDGISYLTTEKSVADHGLSLVANKDCALLRGLLDDGNICRDFDDDSSGVAVASRDGRVGADGARALADFDTAAGGDATAKGRRVNQRPVIDKPLVHMNLARIHKPMTFEDGVPLSGYPLVITVEPTEPAVGGVAVADDAIDAKVASDAKVAGDAKDAADLTAIAEFDTAAGPAADSGISNGDPEYVPAPDIAAVDAAPKAADPDTDTDIAAADDASDVPWRARASRVQVDDGEPAAGLYFVIGSFREHENARKLRNQFRALTPAVLAAKLDHGMVYRVVVGPFDQRQAKVVHQRIYRAGIIDSWAIRVTPGEWTMAMVDPPAKSPLLADLNPEGSRWNPMSYIRKLAQWIY